VLLGGAAIALLLLGRSLVGAKGSKQNPFSLGGYYLGAGVPLVLALGLGLWGYFGFDTMWAAVHTLLIPDGIFPAGEAIMQLFPVEVFGGYLQPVALTFALCAGIVLVLPLLLWPLSKLLTSRFGKGSGASRRQTSAKTAAKKAPAKRTAAKKTTRGAAD
jgi:hypothetical protein